MDARTYIPVEVRYPENAVDQFDTSWGQQVETELLRQSERLTNIEQRQERLEHDLALNSSATFEIHDILTTAKGAFRFFGWVGKAATVLLKLGAVAAATWTTVKALAPHWLPK